MIVIAAFNRTVYPAVIFTYLNNYSMRGVYFAPRLATCTISIRPLQKGTLSFLDVVMQEATSIFLQ